MTLNRRFRPLTAIVLALLLSAPALAEDGDLAGAQFFGPGETQPYGRGPMPNEGYFFCLDFLYWGISRPDTAMIGSPVPRIGYYSTRDRVAFDEHDRIQTSDLDTGFLTTHFNSGMRVEFGRVIDHHGWMLSTYRLDSQNQQHGAAPADIVFDDMIPTYTAGAITLQSMVQGVIGFDLGVPVVAPLPMTFNTVTISNKTITWGVELMGLYRSRELHNGAFVEFLYGARYLELNEDFTVVATGGFTSTLSLDDAGNSVWVNRAENHIVGPQIGMRYFHKMSRWMINLEGRFLAAYNQQNVRQNAWLGDALPTVAGNSYFPITFAGNISSDRRSFAEFTPLVELRTELRLQVTRNISIRAGWTGMWMDNIARASSMITYTLPAMSIDPTRNRQDAFVHGATIGIDINR